MLIDGKHMIDPKATYSALSWLLLRREVSEEMKRQSRRKRASSSASAAYLETSMSVATEESRESYEEIEGSESILSGAVKVKLGEEWEKQAKNKILN